VPKRSFAYLLAWPFTSQPPIALRQPAAPTRRGPIAPAPVLTQEERTRFFTHLRMVAEQSLSDRRLDQARGTLLRRNLYYSLAWHPSSETTAWLRELERRQARRLGRLETWSPSWTAARSLAVARARRGDKEPLCHFIGTALSSDTCQAAASLNDWAYWIGEVPETHNCDVFMAGDLGPWSGAALLRRFAANLVASEPLADRYAHPLWALRERRGRLLEADPQLAKPPASGVEALLAEGTCQSSRAENWSRFTLASGCWESPDPESPPESGVSMPEPELEGLTNFLYEMGLLKRYKRTGWMIAGIDDPESIAEHSFRTAIIGYLLAVMEGADPAKTAAMCLFHDTQETASGTCPRSRQGLRRDRPKS
jgi:hypothetical protein